MRLRTVVRLPDPVDQDLVNYFHLLPDGSWDVPLRGVDMRSWLTIPRPCWPKIALENAAGLSGSKLAERWGVKLEGLGDEILKARCGRREPDGGELVGR